MPRPRKARSISPTRPNIGVQLAYQRRIDAMLRRLQDAVGSAIRLAWSRRPPVMAQDEGPAAALQDMMERLSREWESRFDEFAQGEARRFSREAFSHADRSLASSLRQAGFTVQFRMTKAAQDTLTATIAEQVNLIKSIPSEYLTQVQGIVMRGAQLGRDLHHVSEALQKQFGVTERRAALIARDQNNKATATITRARQAELGITEAIWLHSHGGRQPRPSHVANDGKRYNIATGWFDPDEKAWCWPGTLINCRCVSRSIIPELDKGATE